MSEESRREKIKGLLAKGGQLTGSAIGGALGFFAAGPAGAAGGSVAGTLVGNVLEDIANRALSSSEKRKVGATATFAIQVIQNTMESGRSLRKDGFFSSKADGKCSDAEEVFEGTLHKAKSEHEEKKLRFLGILYANIAFDEHCKVEEANYSLNLAQSLTYNQYRLLRVFARSKDFNLRNTGYSSGEKVTFQLMSCLEEIHDLFRRNLLVRQDPGSPTGTIVMTLADIVPKNISLAGSGKRLYSLLGIEAIKDKEIEDLVNLLANE